jgi:hypothetical protein
MCTILKVDGSRIVTPLPSLSLEAVVLKKKIIHPTWHPDLENYRAITAERLLDEKTDLTIDRLIKEVGY